MLMTATHERIDIPNGDVVVPADIVVPSGGPSPAVVLLHGTMSQRDEVGGVFVLLAEALAVRGIGSIRLDFRGCGASTRPQTELTIESQVSDATAALDLAARHPAFAGRHLGVLGFSQGGLIAALLAARDPRVEALLTWSSGDLRMLDLPLFAGLAATARQRGSATLVEPWGSFELSAEWFEQAGQVRAAAELAGYRGSIRTINAADDDLVDPRAGERLVRAALTADGSWMVLRRGGHIFALDTLDRTLARQVVDESAAWLLSRLL